MKKFLFSIPVLFLLLSLSKVNVDASGWVYNARWDGYFNDSAVAYPLTASFYVDSSGEHNVYFELACNKDNLDNSYGGVDISLQDDGIWYDSSLKVQDATANDIYLAQPYDIPAGFHTASVDCTTGEAKLDGVLLATSTNLTTASTSSFVAVNDYNNTIDAFQDFSQGVIGYEPINPYPTPTATPTPANTSPAVNSFSGATINEGASYSANGSFTDPDSTSWTATVDYGDGGGTQSLTLNSDKTFSLSHVYKDEGTYTVNVVVTDNQGVTGTGTATVTVNNAPFSVGAITAPSNPVLVNTAITASANYTDPGVLDTHTATWNWGDGSSTTGTVTETNGSGSVNDSHTYTAAGVYPITLTVTDDDGVSNTSTFQYVSVYNPTAQGLFSAGQKYISPAGAYTANTSLTGTVRFGMSYKYQGTVPTGNRQFSMDFDQANLHFNATSVNSLVIANSIGTLTGTGTVNGSGTYNFLVTGSESANTVRIQIKDSSGNTVYDTQTGASDTATPTTSVTAGNVLAH